MGHYNIKRTRTKYFVRVLFIIKLDELTYRFSNHRLSADYTHDISEL